MRSLCAILLAGTWLGLPTLAVAQGGSQPINIDGTAQFEVVQPKFGPTNPVRLRIDFYVAIAGNKVSGSISRSILSKTDGTRVVLADHTQLSGELGKVRQMKAEPGHAVAILSGNTLTLLQALKTGAVRATIRMGSGCSVRVEYAQEVGKGNAQRRGVDGQDIEISGWRQLSASCRLTRG